MNPNFHNNMYTGSRYKSYLGISGIQATIRGENAFHRFADGVDQDTGETSSRVWLPTTPTLPKNGVLVYSDCILFFSSGAESTAHGNMVILGIADTYNNSNHPLFNQRVLAAVTARWGNSVQQWPSSISRCYAFGHSYGSVVTDCFCYQFSSLKPNVRFLAETYGGPRSCIPSRATSVLPWERKRNVHTTDVVSHVPFNEEEAPLAASLTPAIYKNGFNRAGHVCNADVFDFNGNETEMTNNIIPVQDITLSIVSWMTYAQHLTARQHELQTYVDTFARRLAELQSPEIPPPSVTTLPGVPAAPTSPTIGNQVFGPIPSPAQVVQELSDAEQAAMAAWLARPVVKPARAVRSHGVAGVSFMESVRVQASDIRVAKGLSKRLNKLRRLLGPLTNAQRDQIIEAVRLEIDSVEMSL